MNPLNPLNKSRNPPVFAERYEIHQKMLGKMLKATFLQWISYLAAKRVDFEF